MKTLSKILVAITAGVVMMSGASADNNYASNRYVSSESVNPYYADDHTGEAYVGAKAGAYNGYGDGTRNVDDPTAYGVYAGYHFDHSFSVEVEYMDSNGGDYDLQTYGAYGAYRHYMNNTNLYAKGKLGLANTELKSQSTNNTLLDGTEIAGGVGVGYQLSPNLDIEGEYARVFNDDDADVSVDAVTIGARLKF